MAPSKLSAAALDNLPEGTHKDHVVPGLSLRVGKKRRTWMLRYIGQGGKQETDTIGHYVPRAPEGSPSVGLLAAREKARAVLDRIEAGVPAAQEKVVHPKSAKTLGQVIDDYEKMKLATGKGIKSLPHALATVRRCLSEYLDLPAHAFSKADLMKARDKAAKGVRKRNGKAGSPQMADRFMDYLGPILGWAAKEDHIPHNFIGDTHRIGPGLVKRKRVLTDDEIRAIWAATYRLEGKEAQAYGRLVRFLLVVAQRKMECALIRHGDFIDGRWKLDEADTKANREQLLKLPQLALDQLGTGSADELCFPGKLDGKPLGGFAKFKAELDELSGITGWRHHDLRRTASTRMQDLTDENDEPLIPRDTITAVLNHSLQGADAHYLHAKMNKAKGRALQLWATELEKILKQRVKIA